MHMDDYQDLANRTWEGHEWSKQTQREYLMNGLISEVGEAASKIKKDIRDSASLMSDSTKLAISLELGDVLWYVAMLADFFEADLSTVARRNIDKLYSRYERGTIQGSGDNR